MNTFLISSTSSKTYVNCPWRNCPAQKSSPISHTNMELSVRHMSHSFDWQALPLRGVCVCVLFYFEQKNHTWNHTFPYFDKHHRDAPTWGCTLVPAKLQDDRRRQTGWHTDGNMSETSPSVWHAKRCAASLSNQIITIGAYLVSNSLNGSSFVQN